MGYQLYEFRENSLFVEKYSGIVDPDEILKNDKNILDRTLKGDLSILTDISQASTQKLERTELDSLYASIDEYWKSEGTFKNAIYSSLEYFEDFQKANKYVELGLNRPIMVKHFVYLGEAMDWLGLNDDEQKQISKWLKDSMNT